MAHIELSARRDILRPAEKDVARRLHDALSLDHPLALMAFEFRRQPFEHGSSGLLDLQKERRGVAANVEPDGAERSNAADADHLEGNVLERVSIDEKMPVGRQAARIGVERTFGVEMVTAIALGGEMIDERRPILDARLLALDQMREVVV